MDATELSSQTGHSENGELQHLHELIEHASHLLPAQGPITVFIHHNTLHAFEDLPFSEAVKKGAEVFGCHPYWPEERYREKLRQGRIRFAELQEVLEKDLGNRANEELACGTTRLAIRLAMLQYPLQTGATEELVWYLAEANAFRRVRPEVSAAMRDKLIAETRRWVMRDLRTRNEASPPVTPGPENEKRSSRSIRELIDRFGESRIENWSGSEWEAFTLQALWRICCEGVAQQPVFTAAPQEPIRHRDILFDLTGVDTDQLVHEVLNRFCAAFLDQGLAQWQLPRRDEGFYQAFCSLYRRPLTASIGWLKGLDVELARLQDQKISPLVSINESLERLGVLASERESYIASTLVALRGWGGMIHHVETRGDRVVHQIPTNSLIEFLAIRLLLDCQALQWTKREYLGEGIALSKLRVDCKDRITKNWPPSKEQRAFQVFQLAQLIGFSPDVLSRLDQRSWKQLIEEVETFTEIERRRILHLAYELRFYTQTLDAISLHANKPPSSETSPRFQAIFCIDEREESIRRHLEEVAPDSQTFGTAGFFSVAIYYRGIDDAHYVPLCPAVILPKHWVEERVAEDLQPTHRRQSKARRVIGKASHTLHKGTRSPTLGAILTSGVGVLTSIPLVARTIFPHSTSRLRSKISKIVKTPVRTQLQLERKGSNPGPEEDGLGFSLEEMTNIGAKVLQEIGLTTTFSRLVFVLGHGSTSMNNPHESAHDCGACGGARGGPNARALAHILNDQRVRELLAARQIVIPEETRFIGGMHNTSDESVTYYDLDQVPSTHHEELDNACSDIQTARQRDARERSRRFYSAPLTLTDEEALIHVETRAEDLAQVRPEWGHATNALCFVGKRQTTRGLFLDRRAFLVSYDADHDDKNQTILERILGAVFPVCSGINLEYYFSAVDNHGWGAGTKLPHNITSLVGVMDGSSSDLRTGLPWQMVEIHEPVRLLFVIEVDAQAMLDLIQRNAVINRLCRNEWVRLAVLNPTTREMSLYDCGEFHPYQPRTQSLPQAKSSLEWYRGWREPLEFAEILGCESLLRDHGS